VHYRELFSELVAPAHDSVELKAKRRAG
jgi:hypothetical protein